MKTTRRKAIQINLFYVFGFFILLFFLASLFNGCQSRSWSRYTGNALELELPQDFLRPISFSAGRDGEKDLFYETTDGRFKVKTYTDTGMFESEIEFTTQQPTR